MSAQPPFVNQEPSVDLRALRAAAGQIEDAVGDARAIASYASTYLHPAQGSPGTLLLWLAEPFHAISGHVADNLVTFATLLEYVHSAVEETCLRYERTEDDNLAEVGGIWADLPDGMPTAQDRSTPADPGPFLDHPSIESAAEQLGEPDKSSRMLQVYEYSRAHEAAPDPFWDAVAKALVTDVSDLDLYVGEWTRGDWGVVDTWSSAATHVYRALDKLRVNLEVSFEFIQQTWTMTASQAAAETFNGILVVLDQLITTFGEAKRIIGLAALEPFRDDAEWVTLYRMILESYDELMKDFGAWFSIPSNAGGAAMSIMKRFLFWLQVVTAFTDYSKFDGSFRMLSAKLESRGSHIQQAVEAVHGVLGLGRPGFTPAPVK